MKALVKYKKGIDNMEIRELDIPEPRENEVRVKIKACGICGTDIKIFDDEFKYNVPVVIGHEFSGKIDKIGKNIKNWYIGDRVVAEQHTGSCGICKFCSTGKRHLCSQKSAPGYGVNGAFAEYICIPENLLHKIPDTLSYEQAALIEPMAVAAQGILNKAKLYHEDFVVILGSGPIALLALQIVKAQGASSVLVTGIDMDEAIRFGIAKKFGADYTINVIKDDPVEKVKELTDGIGADIVIDLSGVESAINQGLLMLRKEGRFCALGLPHNKVCIPWGDMALKAIDICFSYSSDYISWERCLSMIEKRKINTKEFTQDIYKLEDWREAFDRARSGKALKVIIKP